MLCLFVFEAMRRPRVVSVAIPLRRVTILGLSLSIPVLLLHHEVERMQEHLSLPGWAWLLVGASRSTPDPSCTRAPCTWLTAISTARLDAAGRRLGEAIDGATKASEIDRLLAQETSDALEAHVGRIVPPGRADLRPRDGNGKGWDGTATAAS